MPDRSDCLVCDPNSPLALAGNSYFVCTVCVRASPAAAPAERTDAIPAWVTENYSAALAKGRTAAADA